MDFCLFITPIIILYVIIIINWFNYNLCFSSKYDFQRFSLVLALRKHGTINNEMLHVNVKSNQFVLMYKECS